MSSKAFLDMIGRQSESKDLDKILQGNGASYLNEGTHDVTIVAVDSSKFDEGRISVTYGDESGKQYRDGGIFLASQDGKDYGFGVKALWAATIPNKEALEAFFNEMRSGNFEAFNMLTGMKLRITLEHGKGYIIKTVKDPIEGNKFAAYDKESDTAQTDLYATVQEARDAADAKGLKRAYLRTKKLEATNGEANVKAFLSAVEERQKSSKAGGSVVNGNFVAGTKTPSFV